MPWIIPENNFTEIRLESLNSIYEFADKIGHENIVGTLIYHAAANIGYGIVTQSTPFSSQRIVIGNAINRDSNSPELKHIQECFMRAQIGCQIAENGIDRPMLDKLSINAALNPITAAFVTTFWGMQHFQLGKDLINESLREVYRLARAMNVILAESEAEFVQGKQNFLELVKNHNPSMKQDTMAGRRTEREVILTAVVELAKIYGVDVPVIRQFDKIMKIIERRAQLAAIKEKE